MAGLRSLLAACDGYAHLKGGRLAVPSGSVLWSTLGENQRQVLEGAASTGMLDIAVDTDADLRASTDSSSLTEWHSPPGAMTQRFANVPLLLPPVAPPSAPPGRCGPGCGNCGPVGAYAAAGAPVAVQS